MAIIKCKMCGGELEILEGTGTARCEFCDTLQTVPNLDDEKKLVQFERAERLRKQCEFDKAAGVYETIVADFRQEAEAYWGLVLCKYGIEYVDDPATGKKVPTCHRSSFDSVMDDADFEQVMENAEGSARKVYREEAKAIEELRKSIISVSSNEEPYDIFICYKETAENGDRTLDSVLAQDVYDALTDKGYRVFFSRISLEDKLGVEYEPYIFAALNSAKIMLAFGTDYDYYNAVWVKNEWSRYLKLMAKDKEKHLIPCYKGIDAYDIPKEFAKLQAQDMGKVGAIQDLLRGIDKLVGSPQKPLQASAVAPDNTKNQLLMRRVQLFLEEKNWTKALEYCETMLDSDPENAEVYWLQELSKRKCCNVDELALYYYQECCADSQELFYVRRFADRNMKQTLDDFDNKRKNGEKLLLLKRSQHCTNSESDSEAQKCKQLIVQKRAQANQLDGRILVGTNVILAITASGKVVCSKKKDDQFDIFCNGWDQAEKWGNIWSLVQYENCAIGIDYDGKLHFTEDYKRRWYDKIPVEEMQKWKGIIQLYVGTIGFYGLQEDGTILFASIKDYDAENYHGQDNISGFENIDRILAEMSGRLICRKRDDTLVATAFVHGADESCWDQISQWTDIEQLYGAVGRTIGLKSDGTLVATRYIGDEPDEQQVWAEMSVWTDVGELLYNATLYNSENTFREYALDQYGKVLFTKPYKFEGDEGDDEPDRAYIDQWKTVSKWNNLVGYSDYYARHAIGVKADGTVYAVALHKDCNYRELQTISQWTDVVRIYCNYGVTAAVRADGTVVVVGDNSHGVCNVDHFKLFKSIETLKDEMHIAQEQVRQKVLIAEQERIAEAKHVAEEKRIAKEKVQLAWKTGASIAREQAALLKSKIAVSTNPSTPMHIGVGVNGNVFVSCKDAFTRETAENWQEILSTSIGDCHALGLRYNGTVVASGDNKYGQCNVDSWKFVRKIAAGGWHSVGLLDDGTVTACGSNSYSQSNVAGWKDIVDIAVGRQHTVGLKKDGTVCACGLQELGRCEVSSWSDVKKIYAFNDYTVGIQNNGKILCTLKEFDVSAWNNIIEVATGFSHILGLTADGHVFAAGKMNQLTKDIKTCLDVQEWDYIVSVDAHGGHSVGLKCDGTVVATGTNQNGQCNVSGWTDIVAINAGAFITFGVRRDGTTVTVGSATVNKEPYKITNKWRFFDYEMQLRNYKYREEQLPLLIKKEKVKYQQSRLWCEAGLCQHCGGQLKGLFSKKCASCGKPKDY